MRSIILSVLFLCSLVSTASANDGRTSTVPVPQIATPTSLDAPSVERLQLTKVQLDERALADDGYALQPARGSFWWVVGAIVVAGVILAVLL